MNERGCLLSFSRLGLAVLCLAAAAGPAREEPVRVWTSHDGRELRASLVEVEEEDVILRLETGREARVPLARLSAGDRDFLRRGEGARAPSFSAALPGEAMAPGEIEVSGGPERYFTPHFAFETDEAVSKAFISEAARVYEGTFEALHAIPHGLRFSPPSGKEHFQGAFMSDPRFDAIAESRMASLPGQRVVGLYLGEEQRLLVPYSSLGAERLGSRLTLRKRSDTTTLVHEIVHQVMHRYLPLLPTWFSEGIAEYVSALPYQNGRFEFRNAERGLKKRLEEQYRSDGRRVDGVLPPSYFLSGVKSVGKVDSGRGNIDPGREAPGRGAAGSALAAEEGWSGTVREYRDALLFVYFLMHLDEPDHAGRPVGAFLAATHGAMEESDHILKDLAQFEKERLAYNERVQRFNASLDDYADAAKAYNERVGKYNDQVRSGIPEPERIEVGDPPVEPTRPETLELPERLRELAQDGGRIDLVKLVEKRALTVLLRGRSPEEIDEQMRAQFAGMGIDVRYR